MLAFIAARSRNFTQPSHGHRKAPRGWASRSFSSPPIVHTPGNEVYTKVRNGINKSIDVKITYPPRPENGGPIILALGTGIQLQERVDHTRALAMSTNTIIVQPTYGASALTPFPAPIHATLAVFDWICKNLTGKTGNPATQDLQNVQRIGVCGELVGGSLAAMLALTESHPTKPHVSAAALSNPILDWTDVFPSGRHMGVEDLRCADQNGPGTPKAHSFGNDSDISMEGLILQRRELFRKAEDFFDPFASPLLFFRTPCFDLPYSLSGMTSINSIGEPKDPTEVDTTPIQRKRKYERAYPPTASGLILPPMEIMTGKTFVLKHQTKEIVGYMNKSIMKESGGSQRAQQLPEESRFVAEERDDIGYGKPKVAHEMGEWLGEILRNRRATEPAGGLGQ